MKYQLTAQITDKQDTLIFGVFAGHDFSGQGLNPAFEKKLVAQLEGGDLRTHHGSTLLIPNLEDKRIVLVFCNKDMTRESYTLALKKAYACLKHSNATDAVSHLHLLPVPDTDLTWRLQKNIATASLVLYDYLLAKSKKTPTFALKQLSFLAAKQSDEAKRGLAYGRAIANGLSFTRDLGNTPPNVCTPTYLAKQAKKLTTEFSSLRVSLLSEAQMKKIGMNTLLAVGQGSIEPSTFFSIEYKGGKASEAPFVFVGKGITYDTGGISLKPSNSMLGMQYDMMGAANVMGLIRVVAEMKLPINIIAVVASAENMPDGHALKPNDVIKSLAGITIEITNTDAEGRLVLCDALTYCERFHPRAVIDLATLTGGVVVTFGHIASAIMGNNQPLVDQLLQASRQAADPCWQLPLYEEINDTLKSKIADIVNSPNTRDAQSIVAACFLSRFTTKYPWAHFDIAGTAHTDKENATGRPLETLVQFVQQSCV